MHDAIGGLLKQADLLGKIHAMDLLRREQDAFAEFLDGLRDAVKRDAERLDVLAFERGDERGIEGVADLAGDFLVLAARAGEFLQPDRLVERLAQFDEGVDAVARLLGAGFEHFKKHVLFAEEPLE